MVEELLKHFEMLLMVGLRRCLADPLFCNAAVDVSTQLLIVPAANFS